MFWLDNDAVHHSCAGGSSRSYCARSVAFVAAIEALASPLGWVNGPDAVFSILSSSLQLSSTIALSLSIDTIILHGFRSFAIV